MLILLNEDRHLHLVEIQKPTIRGLKVEDYHVVFPRRLKEHHNFSKTPTSSKQDLNPLSKAEN